MKPIASILLICLCFNALAGSLTPPVTVTNGPLESYYDNSVGYIYVQPMATIKDGVTNVFAKGFCGFGQFNDMPITNSAGEVIGWLTHDYNPKKFKSVTIHYRLDWNSDDPLQKWENNQWVEQQSALFRNAKLTITIDPQ